MAANAMPSLAPPSIFYSSHAIVLHVGSQKQSMLLHEDCTKTSDYFKVALKQPTPLGQARIIKLPDECPKHVAHYLAFLYGAKLPTHIYNSTNPGGLKPDGYELLAHLYVLREHLLDSAFRNAIVDEIIRLRTLRTISDSNPSKGITHSPTSAPVNIT